MTKGAMRVTGPLLDVLEALLAAADFELHGYAIMGESRLSGPTVYRILERLTSAGLLSDRWEDSPEPGKPRRRYHKLTPDGVSYARSKLAERRPSGWVRAVITPLPMRGEA